MILKLTDGFLNRITMYRLTFYCLVFVWLGGFLLSLFNLLGYKPLDLVFSLAAFFIFCILINRIFAYIYKVPFNPESTYITALILALIFPPSLILSSPLSLAAISILAISSKYILAVNKSHIFNPSAFAAVFSAVFFKTDASWWIGTLYMAPFVILAGLLIVRKIQRSDLVVSFFTVSVLMALGYGIFGHQNTATLIWQMVIDSPWMFLAFVMLTEPATTPPKKNLRIIYGSIVGFLFSPFVGIGGFYFSPETALAVGNLFSWAASPSRRTILALKEKKKIADNIYDFVFTSGKKLQFEPGQYMEWTLSHKNPDNRGMRRYFTIASSPTEQNIAIGVKFYDNKSSFKKCLYSLNTGDEIVACQPAGDFTMPKDTQKKLVFIAGGIGITPFRSMVKYILDKNQKRDVIIFYSNESAFKIPYLEIFLKAEQKLGIKIIYTTTGSGAVPVGWQGETSPINEEMIKKYAVDFKDRIFYISGSRSMIVSFQNTLKKMNIPKFRIKTDFFPGYGKSDS